MSNNELDREIEKLLVRLCFELGFCLPPNEKKRIASLGQWGADDFAKEVIAVEGLNPEYEVKRLREIRNRFIEQFGGNTYESENS